MIRDTSIFGRTWIFGHTEILMDVSKQGARDVYNENWDGCRDRWKENYRRIKLLRYTDHPINPPDPKLVEYDRRARERKQAEADKFNRAQQERYRKWLRAKRRSCS
jgi:hypothetical protein